MSADPGQATLEEFEGADSVDGTARCQAYAESTGELCERDSMATLPYCPDHIHLLDPVDLEGNRPDSSTEVRHG